MKKRILAIVLGTAMTLSMVGCGGAKEETPATTPDTKAPAAVGRTRSALCIA